MFTELRKSKMSLTLGFGVVLAVYAATMVPLFLIQAQLPELTLAIPQAAQTIAAEAISVR